MTGFFYRIVCSKVPGLDTIHDLIMTCDCKCSTILKSDYQYKMTVTEDKHSSKKQVFVFSNSKSLKEFA